MSRSVRMPIARSSWSITTTDPTFRSCMRAAVAATVSVGWAVTTGWLMTSRTVRSAVTSPESTTVGLRVGSDDQAHVARGGRLADEEPTAAEHRDTLGRLQGDVARPAADRVAAAARDEIHRPGGRG